MTHPRKAHSARLVAVLVSLATAPAVGAPQSDAPKKGGSSWKLPPSSSPKSPSSASKDDDDAPAGGTLSQADAAALVAMAHAQRVASARGGVVGAWNDSVQLYFAQSTELLAPESFLAVSSPTVIDLAPGSIGLFVQHFPITDGLAFGSIARDEIHSQLAGAGRADAWICGTVHHGGQSLKCASLELAPVRSTIAACRARDRTKCEAVSDWKVLHEESNRTGSEVDHSRRRDSEKTLGRE